MPGSVINPETEDMNTTRPRPSRIFGSTAWVTPIWAVTLMSSCRDKASRDKASTGPFTMTPALLTTPFSAVGSRSARAARAERSVMSSGIGCTFGMRSRLWSASADRAVAYTSHPRPLMRSVMARPIPRPAPVTSTEGGIVFSSRSRIRVVRTPCLLRLEEFKRLRNELFVVLEDSAVSGVRVEGYELAVGQAPG